MNIGEIFTGLVQKSGFAQMTWGQAIMLALAGAGLVMMIARKRRVQD